MKIKYDKESAKVWFIILKFAEVIGVLFLMVGFYGLGLLSNLLVEKGFIIGDGVVEGVLNIWFAGVTLFLLTILALILLILILVCCYAIIWAYLKMNWNWAKLLSQSSKGKKERREELNKIKLKNDETNRLKYGFIKGDIVTVKKDLKIDEKYGGRTFTKFKKYETINQDLTIKRVCRYGTIDLKNSKGKEIENFTPEMLDLKKKFKREKD